MHPTPSPASTARSGHALARWPVIVLGVTLVALAMWLAVGDLRADDGENPDGPAAATTDMADLAAVEAILETVQDAVKRNEFDKARTVLETAIAQFGRDQALRLALADLYLRMAHDPSDSRSGDEEQRRRLNEQAYEQFVAALQIGPRTAASEFAAGAIARALGRPDAAIAHFSSATVLDRTNANYPLHLAQVYFARDELDAANANLAVAVSLDPELATAWGMMAEIELRRGAPRLALQHLEKAVSLEPRLPAWRQMQAQAFNRVAEPEHALAALDALPEPDRYSRLSLERAGQAWGLARQPQEALARYERAIAAGVTDPAVYLDAAAWAERVGDTDRALELARTAAMADVEGARRTLERLSAAADGP